MIISDDNPCGTGPHPPRSMILWKRISDRCCPAVHSDRYLVPVLCCTVPVYKPLYIRNKAELSQLLSLLRVHSGDPFVPFVLYRRSLFRHLTSAISRQFRSVQAERYSLLFGKDFAQFPAASPAPPGPEDTSPSPALTVRVSQVKTSSSSSKGQ